MVERKLIRPALRDYRGAKKPPQEVREPQVRESREVRDPDAVASRDGAQSYSPARRKQAPPEQTNAENFYYLKQMTAKTLLIFVLNDGEELRGWIEWYDKNCLKVHRTSEPNLLVYKSAIKYMYKEREA
jgi:sRNA-binding regulator protein Hfq